MLNSMADPVFETALDRHLSWGLHHLDLKDSIYGKSIIDLTNTEASRASDTIQERGLSVYCLSTSLFHDDVEIGQETWDVQNQWQMGTYPSLKVYEELKPLIAYYHLKGGRSDGGSTSLRWKSSLEDASWPIRAITAQVIADGVSPVICLNPSHGTAEKGYDSSNAVELDLAFMQKEFM